jgi:energy-coupling factor transport system ATP-binding protein
VIHASPPQIVLDRVSYQYPSAADPALHHVDLEIPEGAFALIAGRSGSGKSTLLRCLNGLVPHFSGGRFGGSVIVDGYDTRHYGPRALSRSVGFVFQDPEAQFITSRVEDEIAFGMEQLAVPPVVMRKRVEEMLDLMGIASLRHRLVDELSGGERQRVAVAAALALQPKVLVLDEPTSQLDPWGAEDVLMALVRLNDDLGLTIVLAEHRLERVAGHADRMVVADRGSLYLDGPPRQVMGRIDPVMAPPVVRLGQAFGWQPLPLTIKEGRAAVRADGWYPDASPTDSPRPPVAPVMRLANVSIGYERRPVLQDLDLEVRPGEVVALMGRNGSGKTTLLRSVIGLHRVARGTVSIDGRDVTMSDPATLGKRVGYLPQRADSLLFLETVEDEIRFTLKQRDAGWESAEWCIDALSLGGLLDRNPRDLSVGEQERVALAATLVGQPTLLLLDEPTRGMDAFQKQRLTATLRQAASQGVAIILATHDVELVAGLSTWVVLLGDRGIVAEGSPRETLSGSLTFATQVNKLYGNGFLTVADIVPEPADSGAATNGRTAISSRIVE